MLDWTNEETFLPIYHYSNIAFYKKGSKINTIKIKYKECYIVFKDFSTLESPYTTLQTLANRYNLPIKKAHFPHDKVKSIHYLKSNELSEDISDWNNLLTNTNF